MVHSMFTGCSRRMLSISVMTTGLLFGAFAAEAAQIGVVGLYQVEDRVTFDAALQTFEGNIESNGCSIHREGELLGLTDSDIVNGDIGIITPDRFVVFSCATPVLRSADSRTMFKELSAPANMVVLLEGELVIPPADQDRNSAVPDRAYVMKISYYRNDDPDGRDADLAQLLSVIAPQPDKFTIEAFIGVTHAVGMETPDQVALISYDDRDQQLRFLASDPEILKGANEYNSRHLASFTYFAAVANR